VFDAAAHLHPPHLIRACHVSKRLERDSHLDRPPALEQASSDLPDRVPLPIEIAFVGNREVEHRSERIGEKAERIAAVVKGVEHHGEIVVVPDRDRVAPDLVRDPLIGGRGIPAAAADIHEAIVEHHPDIGALGRLTLIARQRLHEFAEGWDGLIHRFVEASIDSQRFRHAHRPHRRPLVRVLPKARCGRLRVPLRGLNRLGCAWQRVNDEAQRDRDPVHTLYVYVWAVGRADARQIERERAYHGLWGASFPGIHGRDTC
jgi:hypothetical protein